MIRAGAQARSVTGAGWAGALAAVRALPHDGAMRSWLALAISSVATACGPTPPSPRAIGNQASTSAAAQAEDAETARLAALTPGHAPGVYLGAPLAAVSAARPAMRRDETDDVHVAMIDRGDGEIADYTYYVTEEGEQRLYEIIARYHDRATATRRFELDYRGLGAVADDQGLPTVTIDGLPFPVRAWQFDDKLVVIGVFPGSAWSLDEAP